MMVMEMQMAGKLLLRGIMFQIALFDCFKAPFLNSVDNSGQFRNNSEFSV